MHSPAASLGAFPGLSCHFATSRRGQRPASADGLPWATRPLKNYFKVQSLTGLAALALFAVAMFVWDASSTSTVDARIDSAQKRIDDLQGRLDRQGTDITKLVQSTLAPQQQTAPAPVQQPVKLEGIITALNEIKTAVQRPPPHPWCSRHNLPLASAPTPRVIEEKDLTKADWMQIQGSLTARGFNPGQADGSTGNKTRAAIRAPIKRLSMKEPMGCSRQAR